MRLIAAFLLTSAALAQNGTVVISAPKVDVSSSPHTLPMHVVATVPALPTTGCTPGEMAVVLSAYPNWNYANSGTGACVWTNQTGGGGGSGTVTSIITAGPIAGGPITTTGTLSCPTCATAASALTNNELLFGAGLQAMAVGNLTGDITTAGGKATTLATVNSSIGPCGDATHVGQVTLNAKGLTTACTAVAITATGGTVTNVATSGPITGGPITSTGTIGCATCTTNASALTSGQIVIGAGGQATAVGNISGDAFTAGGTVLTFNTVNLTTGACGDATHVCAVTTNAKGLVTNQNAIAITGGGGGGGALPYVVNASSSPQTILAATHGQGINPDVVCFTGAISSGATTGTNTGCAWSKNNAGDVTVAWSGSSVGSIQVMASGPGPSSGGGTVTTVSTSGPISGGPFTVSGTISCPTCTTAASALTNNQLVFGAGSQATAVGDLTGDITTGGGKATTLATVNSNVGACGDATHVSQVILNAKGLATACTAVAITVAGSGTVTSVATTGPITGGPVTTTGTIGCATCTTNGAALTSGQIVIGAGGQATAVGNLSGDATTSGGTVLTLNTVNSSAGACGDATHVCAVTTNAKGLVTNQSSVLITGGGGGSGTVTHTVGPLAANAIMAGNGGADSYTPNNAATLTTGGDIATIGRVESFKAFDLFAGTDPGAIVGFSLITNTTITPYRWMIPSADAAGAIVSDGNGTPGHLSIVAMTGSGNILRASAAVNSVATASPITGGTITGAGTISCPTCVASSGALPLNQLVFGAGGQGVAPGDLTGDVSTGGGKTTTLATVLVPFGLCGDATHVCQVTTDTKGRVITQNQVTITGGGGGGGTVTAVATTGPITGGTITSTGTIACPTCAIAGSILPANQIVVGASGTTAITVGNLSGDVSTAGGLAATLATVNSGPGLCGDATHVCQVTTDGKGRVTLQAQIAISGGGGGVTSVATVGPLSGGTITSTGTLSCPTCAVAASSLPSNQIVVGAGGTTTITVGNLAGDVSTGGGLTTTLATVNGAPGLCGDATHVCQVTTDGKGRVTSQSQISITGGGGIGGSGTTNTMTKFTSSSAVGNSITTDNGTVMNTAGLIAANIDANHAFCASNGTFASCGTLPSIGWNTSIPSGMWVGNNLPTGHPSGAFGEYHFNAANGNSLVYGANNELQLGASQSSNGFVIVATLSNFSTTSGGAGAGLYGEIQCNGCRSGGAGISSEAHMQAPPSNTEIYSETSQCGSAASGRVPTEVGQGHSCTNMLSITGFQTDFTAVITTTTTGGTAVSSTGNPFNSGMCHGGSGCTGGAAIYVGLWIVNDNTLNNRLPYVITGFTDSNHVTVNRSTNVQSNQVTYLGWNNTASNDLVNTVGFTQVGARVRENGTGEFGIAQQWIAGASAHPNKIQLINAPTGNTNAGFYNGIEFWRGALGPDLTMPMLSAVNGYQMAEIRSDMTFNGTYAQGFLDIYTNQSSTLVKSARFDSNGLNLSVIPTSAGSGGLYVCIDTAGQMYKKSSCP